MPFLLMFLLVIVIAIALGTAAIAAVVGAGALVFAIIRQWPWLLIGLGVWMLFCALRGDRRRDRSGQWDRREEKRRRRQQDAPRPVAQPTPAAAPAAGSAMPSRRELPVDMRVKVEQIRHKADVLLGFADRFPPFSHDLHLVKQTAADYLPRTVAAFLALPDDLLAEANQRTALQELRAQLTLLDSKLDEIAQDLQRQDMDRLLANRRFLEDRFRPVPPTQDSNAA